MKRSFIIALFTVVFILGACVPIEKLPPEPAIEFRSFTLYDTVDMLGNDARAGKLTFYFKYL